ncbi:hypothetical protein A9P82_06465 [Arachidicoccus ginsenosidimutans]|uniref:T9SS type A sorting domain-containing protein n=1 Tax=Arachidicoccus sp. BS20 TaxID=1850526 RepID=UPI0007F0D9BB|nr:T9SS type A sorting domain-containing protein [Arachidicoccus sp. BS20]ANI88968.1 hypothetical protein A9P82_06465 [Arachidicoccus sp. BS20]
MKKIFTLIIGSTLLSANIYAQCWVQPDCTNEVTVSGTLTNKNYNGSTCFEGSGTISNSVNINNWDYLSFTGTITVAQVQNVTSKEIYASGNIKFGNISLGGTSTIFVFGNLSLSGYNNNGQTTVILGDESSSITISGKEYHAGDTIKQNSNYIAITSCKATSLPITLKSFTATPTGKSVALTWITGSEINSKGFDIERSANKGSFTKIGFVNTKSSNGNSSGDLTYHYTDAAPLSSTSYYRLKEINSDDTYKYSPVVSVYITAGSSPSVYPNPVVSLLHVTNLEAGSTYRIVNVAGSVAASGSVSGTELSLNISSYASGIYFVNITNKNGKSTSLEFIKK